MSSLPPIYHVLIPSQYKESLKLLIELGEAERKTLFDAIKNTQPALTPNLLTEAIDTKGGIPRGALKGVIHTLVSLAATRNEYNVTSERLAKDVTNAAVAEDLGGLKQKSEEARAFRLYLQELLSLDVPLGITAKVIDVLIQHRYPFRTARILSDVRSIFSSSDTMKPLAGVIVHNLQIHTLRPNETDESHIIAMDVQDLRILRDVIERAIQKEDALKEAIVKGGLDYIDIPYS